MWSPRRRHRRPTADGVRIEDLPERHLESYFMCLEDWSPDMAEAGEHKARWFNHARFHGLRVKLALDEDDRPLGMIQYAPIELSPAEGQDLYMILCIWVHGHSKGVGNVQGNGIGSALLAAAEVDVRQLGAKGVAAWGLHLPIWMKASWFRKHGYRQVDRAGARELVWKPFVAEAEAPRWIRERPVEIGGTGKVEVTAFLNGWCPANNLVYERARRAAEDFPSEVEFTTVDAGDRATVVQCGRFDGVFINGRPLQRGAPPSYRTIRRRIVREIRRRRRQGRSAPPARSPT